LLGRCSSADRFDIISLPLFLLSISILKSLNSI